MRHQVRDFGESGEKEMNINAAFRFHSVGQGLFYSGLLNKKGNNGHSVFSFVYDCGTDSSPVFLQREIDDYKLLLPTVGGTKQKKLDLLVVSHLHDDHVNGLEYLLKDIEVDTVIMPYTNDGLKLLARMESHSNQEFLQVFYADPVSWFLSKGVHRILLIGSEEILEEQDDSVDDRHQYNEKPDFYLDQESILKIDYIAETEIAFLRNKTKVKYNIFNWKFLFENLKLKNNKENQYIQIVEEFKQKKCLTLEQISKSELLIKDLRKQVKAVFTGGVEINRTSVVMLHRPVMPVLTCIFDFYQIKRKIGHMKHFYEMYCGDSFIYDTIVETFLTGDIEIKDNEHLELFDERIEEDKSYLLIQYPHHGSKNKKIIIYNILLT